MNQPAHDLMLTFEAMMPGDVRSAGEGLSIGFGLGASPFGDVCLAWTSRGICHFAFLEQPLVEHAARLRHVWPCARFERDDAKACRWLDEIFPVVPGSSRIHLLMRGSIFQIRVWEALIHTRPGDVLSYGQLAERIGHPRAQRAVGTALSRNEIGYLIPCHRIIKASGGVGQYRWGADRKLAIQIWERS